MFTLPSSSMLLFFDLGCVFLSKSDLRRWFVKRVRLPRFFFVALAITAENPINAIIQSYKCMYVETS